MLKVIHKNLGGLIFRENVVEWDFAGHVNKPVLH